ncbi:hypothetical protein CDAR_561181 [Caerostris darwini]|uniref:Uncharacterized protein n=1 Tax=Caerostris darwini TaxID=1538125 RepID=A0AAV4TCG2_9ARAC|nr:hypothetical protein CDAR_561181 [Caerostris darwini]
MDDIRPKTSDWFKDISKTVTAAPVAVWRHKGTPYAGIPVYASDTCLYSCHNKKQQSRLTYLKHTSNTCFTPYPNMRQHELAYLQHASDTCFVPYHNSQKQLRDISETYVQYLFHSIP